MILKDSVAVTLLRATHRDGTRDFKFPLAWQSRISPPACRMVHLAGGVEHALWKGHPGLDVMNPLSHTLTHCGFSVPISKCVYSDAGASKLFAHVCIHAGDRMIVQLNWD